MMEDHKGAEIFYPNLNRIISHHKFLPWCFVIYFLLRSTVLFAVPVVPESDAGWYVARGLQIAAGGGYYEDSVPTAFWPVGYPAFLATIFYFFGPHVIAAKLANLALSCGIFFFTYSLARLVFVNALAARVAVLLLTIYPNQIAYTGVLFSEMLLTFLLLFGIILFIDRSSYLRLFFSSLVFGLASLVKAQMLFVPVILLGLNAFHSRIGPRLIPTAAVIALGMACIIFPWSVRNYAVFHHFILISTNGGATFLSGNNPQARGDYTPDAPLVKDAHFSVADQVASDKRAYALAIGWIKHNPGRFLELIPMKIWRLWAPDGEGEWWYQRGYSNYDAYQFWFHFVRIINQIYYSVIIIATCFATAKIYFVGEARRPWVTVGFWLAVYVTMVTVIFSGQSRFHFPLMPWVCIYAGWLVARWMNSHNGYEASKKRQVAPAV